MFSWRTATLLLLSILVLETAILIDVYLNAESTVTEGELLPETLPLFNLYDANGDGVIDVSEFEPVQRRISETYSPQLELDDSMIPYGDIEKNFEKFQTTNGETVDIKAEFEPLVLDSMSKFKDEQSLTVDMQALTGLQRWLTASREEAEFAVEAFKCFLPKRKNYDLGEAWAFVVPDVSIRTGPHLSSRYAYPSVNGDHLFLQCLLQMFHPTSFLYSRFPPKGGVACVRAESDEFLEIEFRLHAEFQLNTPPLLPFWFTPAQFSGRLIVSKDGSHIERFEMEVPNNQSLNVDMEWLVKPKEEEIVDESEKKEVGDNHQNNMEVDIGYLPKMKLKSMAPSLRRGDAVGGSSPPVEREINWKREITDEEARTILVKKMYPFKKVPYLLFDAAFSRAKEEKKLVHSILLWGALDDQSC